MKLIKFSTMCLIAVGFFARAFAQAELPTQSQGVLVSMAIQQASSSDAWMNVAGSTVTTSLDNHHTWTPGQGSEVLLTQCRFNVTVETFTPDRNVGTNIAVNNKDGDLVLEGYTNSRPTQVGGVWTLPKAAGDIVLRSVYIYWLTLEKAVNQAFIVAMDKNGDEQWYELAVNGRKIGFARDSAGLKNAYIRAHFTDGKVAAWTIETGAQLNPVPLSTSTTARLDNFSSFKNTTVVSGVAATVVISVNDDGVGVVPSIEMDMTATGQAWVKVSTSKGKLPISFRVLSPSGKWSSVPSVTLSQGGFSIPLEVGKSYVVPVFKAGDLDEIAQPVQTGGFRNYTEKGRE